MVVRGIHGGIQVQILICAALLDHILQDLKVILEVGEVGFEGATTWTENDILSQPHQVYDDMGAKGVQGSMQFYSLAFELTLFLE